jgi:uncharacterized membrane protein YgaE (UPF0421/DUF939 family)
VRSLSASSPRAITTAARRRLRPHVPAILQTAAAALGAWWLAILLLPNERPAFASIAAVICLGVTHGQRRSRALQLLGGVVLGITVASLLLFLIGTGPWQIALLVVLAMSAALLFGGGELLVTEAAISAILLASLEQTSSGFSADRILEGMIGGGVGLAVASLLLPPDPIAMVGQVAQTVFGKLGRTLEETALALEHNDPAVADSALQAARGIDEDVEALESMLLVAGETARYAPQRRAGLPDMERYRETMPQIDFAVRNTRVLARHVVRYLRTGRQAPPELAEAMHDLSVAVWALAADLDDPARDGQQVRLHASRAAARAVESFESDRDLGLAEIAAQVRSTAIDLVRAAEAGGSVAAPPAETPTEELLIQLPAPA